MQRIGAQIMEMLCDLNSFVAFHAGEVQATGAISSVVDLQNLLGTALVLSVVFNLKTKADTTESGESPPQQTAEESKRIL